MQKGRGRERLRFAGITRRPTAEGGVSLVVELEWSGTGIRGEAPGTGSTEGDLRASGEAAIRAARAATNDRVYLALIGLKSIRAFDGRVVIAAVEVRAGGKSQKLLGAQALTDDELLLQTGVLTVLGAINRAITPYLSAQGDRPPPPPQGGR